MDPRLIVDWISAMGAILLPVVLLIIVWSFRRPIGEWLRTADRVSVGPIELSREIEKIADTSRQILADTTKLQLLIAESRAIEVEVFLSYPLISDEQRHAMEENLTRLKLEIGQLRKDPK